VIVAVLVLGYALYGGMAVVGGTLHDRLSAEDSPDAAPASGIADANASSTSSAAGSGPPFVFDRVGEERGLEYQYNSTYGGNHRLVTNAGVYVADYDRDGWDDVLAVGGDRPVLYTNRGGRFVASGALDGIDRSVRTALFVDYDADGWRDLLLLSIGRSPLLLENDNGTFSRRDAGFRTPLRNPVGATTGDYDADGCPDLYVIQYGNWSTRLPTGYENYSATAGGDNGSPNRLYDGHCGSFDRVEGAPTGATRWSLATSTADLDGDDRPDIHVANDFNHDVVYLNRGNGSFREVVLGERTNRNGMSSELGDVNGDRRLDVFVTNIYYPDWAAARINAVLRIKASGNNLLVNRANGTFLERSGDYGVRRGGWGWAAVMADLDNDGDEDLFHTTRTMSFRLRDAEFSAAEIDRLERKPMYNRPVAWERRDGQFDSVDAERAGFVTANGRGAAALDFDRDGALDLLVAAPGDQGYVLYENANASGRRALQVRVGDNGTLATGADVVVRTDGETQWRQVRPGTDFLSQDPGYLHVGVGRATAVDVRVTWPDGTERLFRDVRTDRRIVISRAGVERARPLGPDRAQNRSATGD